MAIEMDFCFSTFGSTPRSSMSSRQLSKAARVARDFVLFVSSVIFLQLLLPPWPAIADCSLKANGNITTVLDVGHTAAAPGAVSARGVNEYEFNINLARRINEELLRAGFQSTYLMVTSGGLLQRPTQANNMNADLFLSIHHDTVPDEYLHSWQYEGEGHWFSDDFSGFAIFVSGKNGDYQHSLIFAKALADHLMSSGLEPRTGPAENRPTTGRQFIALDRARGIFRFDDFAVLRETEMPAVIFEAGMIVNRDEEARLGSPSGRALIAKAVTEAVQEFCLAGKTSSYQVTHVASDDVLYVRSGPSANLPSIGTIPPDGRGVRIVGACKGTWCPIEYDSLRGWVNSRYLTAE